MPRKPSPWMLNQRGRKTARRRLRGPVPRRRITVMIEKIGNLAERLATNVSQSRRGFLARVGQAALGAAGALGALLALPGAAQAGASQGLCVMVKSGTSNRGYAYNGTCVTANCTFGYSSACYGLTRASNHRRCGAMVGRKCSF